MSGPKAPVGLRGPKVPVKTLKWLLTGTFGPLSPTGDIRAAQSCGQGRLGGRLAIWAAYRWPSGSHMARVWRFLCSALTDLPAVTYTSSVKNRSRSTGARERIKGNRVRIPSKAVTVCGRAREPDYLPALFSKPRASLFAAGFRSTRGAAERAFCCR